MCWETGQSNLRVGCGEDHVPWMRLKRMPESGRGPLHREVLRESCKVESDCLRYSSAEQQQALCLPFPLKLLRIARTFHAFHSERSET